MKVKETTDNNGEESTKHKQSLEEYTFEGYSVATEYAPPKALDTPARNREDAFYRFEAERRVPFSTVSTVL